MGVGKGDAPFLQAIDIRGRHQWFPLRLVGHIVEVIDDDEDDVGTLLRHTRGEKGEKKEKGK